MQHDDPRKLFSDEPESPLTSRAPSTKTANESAEIVACACELDVSKMNYSMQCVFTTRRMDWTRYNVRLVTSGPTYGKHL